MKKKGIPIEKLFAEWMKDPEFRREYEALGPSYDLGIALIEARSAAGLTQLQVAERMQSSEGFVARLEGFGRRMPTMRAIERYAAATGHRVKISFERLPPS